MKWTVIAAVVTACGGGASIPGGDVDPMTRVVGSNCQLINTTVTVDVAYETTIAVGQGWEAQVLVLDGGSFGAQTSESSFFNCGLWNEIGSGQSAKGCARNTADQPATQNVSHMFSASFENQITPSLDIMIFASTVDLAGDFSVGNGANDSFTCF